jgi:pSer/pThr/pTyr-binding forkhead associated (FHA) protein
LSQTMPSFITLTLTQSDEQSTEYTFDDTATIGIGRSQSNEIAIPLDTSLSREHCQIMYQQEQWYLEDLDSKNGTFLESKTAPSTVFRIQERIILDDGQRIRIGRTWLTFDLVPGPAPT